MRIKLSTNASGVSRRAKLLFADQLPFASSVAINKTLKQAQKAQRRHMEGAFTLRRPGWVKKSVKITRFSDKKDRPPTGRIEIEPQGGRERADIIARHERAGIRRPRDGRALAIPTGARQTKRGLVPKALMIKRLQFRRVRSSGPNEIYVGKKRTFMIRRPDGSGVILQRTGSGKSGTFAGTEELYRFKPTTPIRARLQFLRTIDRVVTEKFPANFRRAWRQAIRTAR